MILDNYLTYLSVLVIFFATPPDTSQLLIMSNSLRHGLRRSLATVAGDLSANTLQMTAAAFGLTAVLTVSADALTVVKWLGVCYLGWIGLNLIVPSGRQSQSPRASSAGSQRILFRQGFLTSSANPYAVVFFGALFPQFIDPALPVWPQLFVLGATYLIVDGLVLILWGWSTIQTLGRVRRLSGVWINRISGGLMICGAAFLALKDLTVETKR